MPAIIALNSHNIHTTQLLSKQRPTSFMWSIASWYKKVGSRYRENIIFTAPLKYQIVCCTAGALSTGGVVCLQFCPSQRTSVLSPKSTVGVRLRYVLTFFSHEISFLLKFVGASKTNLQSWDFCNFCQKLQRTLQQSCQFRYTVQQLLTFSVPKTLNLLYNSFAQMAVCLLQKSKSLGLQSCLMSRGCTLVLIIELLFAWRELRARQARRMHKVTRTRQARRIHKPKGFVYSTRLAHAQLPRRQQQINNAYTCTSTWHETWCRPKHSNLEVDKVSIERMKIYHV